MDYVEYPKQIKLSLEKREEIAKRIVRMWDSSQEAKGDGPSGWWRSVETLYRTEPPDGVVSIDIQNDRVSKSKPSRTGISQFRLPQILYTRVNALNAQLCTVISRQSRYMTASEGVPADVARKKETLVHRLWEDGGFVRAIRQAGLVGSLLNKPIFRVYPEYGDTYGGRVGVCIEALHPKDLGIFPSTEVKEDWQLCAHRKHRRQGVIKQMMRSGEYFDLSGTYKGAMISSDPSSFDDTGMYAHSRACLANASVENDSRQVQLVVGQVKLDISDEDESGDRTKGERWYRFVLAYDEPELLSFTEYGFSQPEYFMGSIVPDMSGLWGGMSVGRMLYPIQDAVNKMVSAFYEMAMRACAPPIIGPELASGEKYSELPFGSYVATDETVTPWSPSVTSQLEPINGFIVAAERWADQVARVSQNTLGTIQARETTATTDSIVAAGVQVGQEEYLANFSIPFAGMAQLTEEIALSLYPDLVAYYQGRIGTSSETPITPEEIAVECTWEATGKNPNSTPTAKVQDAMQLIEIAADPEYGFDKYALGQVIAQNSSLVGVQVQKPKEQVEQELAEMQQAQMHMMQMEAMQKQGQDPEQAAQIEMQKMQMQHGLDQEKEDAKFQRDIIANRDKAIMDAATRPAPSSSNGKAGKGKGRGSN